MSLQLVATADLTPEAQLKLEQDYQTVERRDNKTSRADFGVGWMACAQRYGIRHVFTAAAQTRLWP
jgi:hypothetical protein